MPSPVHSEESHLRAIAFGFLGHRSQAGKLIPAASANFSTRKSALLRAMYEQIDTIRSRIQTGSVFFCDSGVKEIPNAIALNPTSELLDQLNCSGADIATGVHFRAGVDMTDEHHTLEIRLRRNE
jgi:hypothetical protein